jgi:hypothetical protein
LLQIIKDLGNRLGPVGRQFLKSGFDAGMARAGIGQDNSPKKARQLAGLFLEAGSGGRGRHQLKW